MSTQQPVIVVGVDLSDTARKAAEKAAGLARALGGRLHFVSAVKEVGLSSVSGPGSDSWYVDLGGPTEDYIDDLAAQWPDLTTTKACLVGKPAEVIVREAAKIEASIIVVGNKRMSGISRVLGAVAAEVARHASCDVYIAHTVG